MILKIQYVKLDKCFISKKIELEKPWNSPRFQNSRHFVKANSAKESGKTFIPSKESE